MNILVTGAGGPAGVCTIKALKGKHRVIGIDMDSYASGLYIADVGYKVPASSSKNYIPRILEICNKEHVDFVFPTVGEELSYFADAATNLFAIKKINVAVAGPSAISIANDKAKTYAFFKGESFCPKVYDSSNAQFPCVVKPANSRGSRGFNICSDIASLAVALERNKVYGDSLIMEYLDGPEYSVYGLSDLNGRVVLSLANRRITAKGESKVAELTRNESVCKVASTIASKIGLIGPWNIQLINNKVVDINPRMAGSTSLIMASGIDYVGLVIKVFTGQKIHPEELLVKNHVFMIRYNEEIFLKPENIQQ
jgi:carbamoyl-phosphate synthase large subunit